MNPVALRKAKIVYNSECNRVKRKQSLFERTFLSAIGLKENNRSLKGHKDFFCNIFLFF